MPLRNLEQVNSLLQELRNEFITRTDKSINPLQTPIDFIQELEEYFKRYEFREKQLAGFLGGSKSTIKDCYSDFTKHTAHRYPALSENAIISYIIEMYSKAIFLNELRSKMTVNIQTESTQETDTNKDPESLKIHWRANAESLAVLMYKLNQLGWIDIYSKPVKMESIAQSILNCFDPLPGKGKKTIPSKQLGTMKSYIRKSKAIELSKKITYFDDISKNNLK